jgi:hypothetical protein
MSDTGTQDAGNNDGKIEFLNYHYPPLEAGDYKIVFHQQLQATAVESGDPPSESYEVTRRFAVAGERFQLKDELVHSVFPPEASLGEHSNVLPHIILSRSTLPWERRAIESTKELPWLALLLFADEEKPTPRVLTLGDLTNSSGAQFPEIELESGQTAADKVTVIDVPKGLLDSIIPSKNELQLLAHVRQSKDADGNLTDEEQAVIICNRLPARGASSTVHLVSVEDRFSNDGFDSQTDDDSSLVRLVSLRSWSFACADEDKSFKGLLENLNRNPATPRLPESEDPTAERYLRMGCMLLPHSMRQGQKTASWYHGPLATGENTTEVTLPAKAADELVRYNGSTGLFDVSYAAAWELGRLLALQSKQFSIDLYNWKRANAQQIKQAEQQLLYPSLAVASQSNGTVELPQSVSAWFANLSMLEGVPFNYLVPDERMLPAESIRFFCVDGLWVDCLLDGAYSIGRVTTSDYELDQSQTNSPASSPYEKLTGLLLRSDVVAGWRGLLVDGYEGSDPLNLLRMDRLSDDVLLCLYDGGLSRVEIHQKPETLHFGLDRDDEDPDELYKMLRDDEGVENTDPENTSLILEAVPWRNQSRRVLDIMSMAQQIQSQLSFESFTSAEFALEMIEGVEKVSFEKSPQ